MMEVWEPVWASTTQYDPAALHHSVPVPQNQESEKSIYCRYTTRRKRLFLTTRTDLQHRNTANNRSTYGVHHAHAFLLGKADTFSHCSSGSCWSKRERELRTGTYRGQNWQIKGKDQKKLLWLKHNREEWLISQGQLHPGMKTFITSHFTRGAVGQDLNIM